MSYLLGDLIDLAWEVEVDDEDADPTIFTVYVTEPDGTSSTLTTTHPSLGHYAASVPADQPGHYTWVAIATGAAVAAADGVFDVFDPNPQTPPITGLAAPWSDAAALARRPQIVRYNNAQLAEDPPGEPIEPGVLADAIRFASEILYGLSGRQFSGLARTHCRPVARPEGWDVRSWGSAAMSYWQSWGSGYTMGYGAASVPALGYHMGQNYPHEVALNYPIQRVEEVKVDGVVIPTDQYRVDDYRLLVRTRPTAQSQPTARGDWPHWQALWLPDDQPNTFCADEETEILTAEGWRSHSDLSVGDEVYALDPETRLGHFEPLLAVNVFPAVPRTVRRIETANFSSLTTLDHRWPVWQRRPGLIGGDRFEWRTTESLRQDTAIFRSAPCADLPVDAKWSDAFVELVAWFWCEGSHYKGTGAKGLNRRISILQSEEVYPQHAAAIRRALGEAFPAGWSEYRRADGIVEFRLRVEPTDALVEVTGEAKAPRPDFLRSLTPAQLRLLIERCIDGDGHRPRGRRVWNQQSEHGLRIFEMACALAGIATNTYRDRERLSSWGKPYCRGTVSLLASPLAKPIDAARVASYRDEALAERAHPVDSVEDYDGVVWCPTTPSGTWLARRRGTVYFTGNSVTYWYGVGPPQSGVTAAEVFATELALDAVGADNRLPARIREISRQGETAMIVDSLEALTKGWTGIPICDYFLSHVNPNRLMRRGSVWTPDMGRVRTPTSGTS